MNEIVQLFLALMGTGSAGYVTYAISKMILQHVEAGQNPLADFFVGEETQETVWSDQIGGTIAARLPISLETWQAHLAWAQRGGKYRNWTVNRMVFLSLLLCVVGFYVAFHNAHALAAWTAPLIGAAIPFIWVRSAANKTRRRVERMLPELAALVAAELSAGQPAEQALRRAAELPGPLADLLQDALSLSQSSGRPLLTHAIQQGTLREVFGATGLPALRAFAVQLDLAAQKGVEVAERMVEISKVLSSEYRQRLMENTEKLETNLTTAVAAFYFAPMLLVILLPMFGEILKAI